MPGTSSLNSTIAEPPAGIERRLHVVFGDRAALGVDGVEDLADHVEGRDQVRAAVADEEAHLLAHLRRQRAVADEGAVAAVEDARRPGVRRSRAPCRRAGGPARGSRLACRTRSAPRRYSRSTVRAAALGLDHDQAVHAVRDVHADRRRRAVVDVDARVQRRERELRLVPGRGERAGGAAARARDRVQVDVVRHRVVGVVHAGGARPCRPAHADHRAGHAAAEGPERVLGAVRDLLHDLLDLELHDHLRRARCARGRRRLRARRRAAPRRREARRQQAMRQRSYQARWATVAVRHIR